MNKRLILAAASSAAILCSYAQINSPAPDGYLQRAVLMYADGNYFGCIDQLINIDESELSDDLVQQVRFYRAVATVHTDKTLASELLQTYLADYPEAMNRSEAMMALGDCYYGSDYRKALSIYNNVYAQGLTEAGADELTYRKAYSYLMLKDYAKSLNLFDSLAGSLQYGNAAKFYQGYIAYTQGNYAKAEQILKDVDTATAPGNMADFYLSQIYFMRADYSKALAMAKSLLKHTDVAEPFVAEAYRIAGESSYQLGDEAQALKYLTRYVSMVEAPLPSALYILALNAYGTGDFSKSIEYLKKVANCDDAMGQSALLYLGQAYMHIGDYSAAAMALNKAANMDYDSDVRETAYYNYAVASNNGGKVPFASTVKAFADFLNFYPDSKYAPDVQEYIITSYLTDNNYAAALASINDMTSPSSATLGAKQRVLYVLGNRALATADYSAAQEYLSEAVTLDKYNKNLAQEVSLALGEAYYGLGEYAKSATQLQRYITGSQGAENLPLAYYDLGYSLFAQKKYYKAAEQFALCLKRLAGLPVEVIADAYNRLGDCYYYEKDFAKAESAYNSAYEKNPSTGDYSLFQKALMAGYQRNHTQKIEILDRMQRLFPTSALIPDAMLETTEGYIQLGKNQQALDVYRKLVSTYPNTAQGRQGYLQMALVKLNSGDRRGAVADYKEVIRRYPTSDEAHQAVEQMKRIAAADGTLADFTQFLRNTSNAPQIDESEVEQLTFENAEQAYLASGNIDKLKSFIIDYPSSNMRARAISYIVEHEYAKGNEDSAYKYASALAEQYPESSYTQQALIVKAQIEESQGKGNLALRTWKQLAQGASSPANLLVARMGIIRNGREAKEYNDVIEAADAVIASSGVGTDDLDEAIYSRGYVYEAQGKAADARTQWQKIAGDTDNLFGIQGAYKLGESYFTAKDYAQAEKWAKAVSSADSPHAYWIARGFILLSDVYAAKGDKYKAQQYLEAVRDNYSGTEADIFEMIDQRLNKLTK